MHAPVALLEGADELVGDPLLLHGAQKRAGVQPVCRICHVVVGYSQKGVGTCVRGETVGDEAVSRGRGRRVWQAARSDFRPGRYDTRTHAPRSPPKHNDRTNKKKREKSVAPVIQIGDDVLPDQKARDQPARCPPAAAPPTD